MEATALGIWAAGRAEALGEFVAHELRIVQDAAHAPALVSIEAIAFGRGWDVSREMVIHRAARAAFGWGAVVLAERERMAQLQEVV